MKILIADAMSGEAVDILKSKGLSVDVKTDLKKGQGAVLITWMWKQRPKKVSW